MAAPPAAPESVSLHLGPRAQRPGPRERGKRSGSVATGRLQAMQELLSDSCGLAANTDYVEILGQRRLPKADIQLSRARVLVWRRGGGEPGGSRGEPGGEPGGAHPLTTGAPTGSDLVGGSIPG